MFKFVIYLIILPIVIISCESDPYGSSWNEDISTICQYIETNREEYSKFYTLLEEGEMLDALCAYNPYGEGFTLFLPTNEAIDHFVEQNQDYENFEEMLLDTSFIQGLVRYHTLNKSLHTDNFPDGALIYRTITGDRLTFSYYTENDNPLIKVNNVAPIIKSNLEMTNGYIHVISGVLQQAKTSGYDWIQQNSNYSILAEAMEMSGLRYKLWWNEYTILAEHDSIYNRHGIMNVNDLIYRIASPGIPLTSTTNSFYQFSAFHILNDDIYLNDLAWGNKKYITLTSHQLTIDVGNEIRINPGVETFKIAISESGDTTIIDYIIPEQKESNIRTNTGPVHSISDLLFYEPFPE